MRYKTGINRNRHLSKSAPVRQDRRRPASWDFLFEKNSKEKFEKEILPDYLRNRRWFGGKARTIQHVKIIDNISIETNTGSVQLLLLEVCYTEGSQDTYLLPLSLARKTNGAKIVKEFSSGIIAKFQFNKGEGIIYDGVYDKGFQKSILSIISQRKKIKGKYGEIVAYSGNKFKNSLLQKGSSFVSKVLKVEQSNTAVLYGNKLFLKLFRRLEEGINPDFEIVKFLTEKKNFSYVPPFAGGIEYRRPGAEPSAVGILQGFIPNKSDAWTYILNAVNRYFEKLLKKEKKLREIPKLPSSLFDTDMSDTLTLFQELMGKTYVKMIEILGKRTGQLHLSLSSAKEDPGFLPEPFSLSYQESVYESMRTLTEKVMQTLEKHLKKLPELSQNEAKEILDSKQKILNNFKNILQKEFSVMKIRVHGDYHLGQVLFTGKDFVIIDFEGEPARKLSERKSKHCALRDVAGMVRSFHYAPYSVLFEYAVSHREAVPFLEKWIELWYYSVSGIFLKSYFDTVGDAAFIPKAKDESKTLFDIFLLEKSVYELGYELNNRPDWVSIPIKGIKYILRNS